MISKTILTSFIGFLCFVSLALAGEKPVNTTLFGVAIKGYDPVAYFTEGKPMKGDSRFSYEWKGATWRFARAEHRDAFMATPEKYAPQFGGYCAWAVSQNYTANTDPENAWRIVDGKLYLNYSRDIQTKWERDVPGNIAKGELHWPKLIE
ncbi:MAG TPA: YHS domain-containing (seleno)protein [Opitutaceae bacterium]|nr:YHS domain-containing (seleno)protein [Opitutaceae bacterium]